MGISWSEKNNQLQELIYKYECFDHKVDMLHIIITTYISKDISDHPTYKLNLIHDKIQEIINYSYVMEHVEKELSEYGITYSGKYHKLNQSYEQVFETICLKYPTYVPKPFL